MALCVAALMWLTPAAAGPRAVPAGLRHAIALGLFGIGLGIGLSGIVAFRRARTTINPVKVRSASALVTSGIYRYTRNPMYLGLLVALVAWAVYLSRPLALLVVPVYVLYITRFQIVPEERVLGSLFGTTYSAYRERVGRWL